MTEPIQTLVGVVDKRTSPRMVVTLGSHGTVGTRRVVEMVVEGVPILRLLEKTEHFLKEVAIVPSRPGSLLRNKIPQKKIEPGCFCSHVPVDGLIQVIARQMITKAPRFIAGFQQLALTRTTGAWASPFRLERPQATSATKPAITITPPHTTRA